MWDLERDIVYREILVLFYNILFIFIYNGL